VSAGRTAALALLAAALPLTALSQTVVVTAERGANLRQRPDMAAAVVARVEPGAALEMVDRTDDWYEVVVPASGETAWVHASVVRVVDDTGVPPPAAPPPRGIGVPRSAPPPEATEPAAEPAPPATGAEPAAAPGGPGRTWSRLTAFASGALATSGASFHGERRFTEFAEEGRIESDYARGAGPGLEVGLEYALGRRFGLAASVNLLGRGASSSYDGSLPHPLYLERPRRVSGTLDGLSYRERALHLGLTWRAERGRLRYGVSAGPSHGRVSAELVERIEYRQAYPFDEVQVTTVPRATHRGSGFGFNAGAELDYRWRPGVAAALRLRYHRFGPDLPDAAGTVDIDGGAFQIGVGLRFFLR
jgi:hypothetical protein